jgi:oligoribonuclease
MDEWNQSHHGKSGLLDRVRASTETVGLAESKVLHFCALHLKPKSSPLCGNSIGQDRRFLNRYMPSLHDYFHYRSVDVSTVKELVRRWYPDLPVFQKAETHLALADIRESVGELKFYREHVFRK